MTSSEGLYKSRHRYRHQNQAGVAIQSVLTVAAVFFLFIAILEFFHALRPLPGLGAQFVEASQTILNTLIDSTISPLFPAIDRAASNYLLMMTALITTITATARDPRVHLVSLVLAVSALVTMYLYSLDLSATAEIGETATIVGPIPYAIISLFCGAVLVGIAISFRLKHVPRRIPRFVTKRKDQFLMLYWTLVVVFGVFQFFFLMSGPQSTGEEASSAIVIIAATATIFLLALYMLASILVFVQIVLWNGVFALDNETRLSLMEVVQQPFPAAVDYAAYPAASITLTGIIAFAWIIYSVCAVSGALNKIKLLGIYLVALAGALIIVLISAFH